MSKADEWVEKHVDAMLFDEENPSAPSTPDTTPQKSGKQKVKNTKQQRNSPGQGGDDGDDDDGSGDEWTEIGVPMSPGMSPSQQQQQEPPLSPMSPEMSPGMSAASADVAASLAAMQHAMLGSQASTTSALVLDPRTGLPASSAQTAGGDGATGGDTSSMFGFDSSLAAINDVFVQMPDLTGGVLSDSHENSSSSGGSTNAYAYGGISNSSFLSGAPSLDFGLESSMASFGSSLAAATDELSRVMDVPPPEEKNASSK
jgi:hypothetical protein